MPIGNAISFVKKVGFNTKLREQCIQYANKDELLSDLGFNETEFEDALNMQLIQCQTYEEAEVFQQIKMWFALL